MAQFSQRLQQLREMVQDLREKHGVDDPTFSALEGKLAALTADVPLSDEAAAMEMSATSANMLELGVSPRVSVGVVQA